MTKEEIKALIAEKIAGQGNQVDSGNGLPTILNGLIELIENAAPKILVSTKSFEGGWDEDLETPAEAAAFLGVTKEEFAHLEDYTAIQFTNAKLDVTSLVHPGEDLHLFYGGLYDNPSNPRVVSLHLSKGTGSFVISSFKVL